LCHIVGSAPLSDVAFRRCNDALEPRSELPREFIEEFIDPLLFRRQATHGGDPGADIESCDPLRACPPWESCESNDPNDMASPNSFVPPNDAPLPTL
jgi:hypothetical protein